METGQGTPMAVAAPNLYAAPALMKFAVNKFLLQHGLHRLYELVCGIFVRNAVVRVTSMCIDAAPMGSMRYFLRYELYTWYTGFEGYLGRWRSVARDLKSEEDL